MKQNQQQIFLNREVSTLGSFKPGVQEVKDEGPGGGGIRGGSRRKLSGKPSK